MLKSAYVISRWIGTGADDDPQRLEVADENIGYCEDRTGQFVKLDEDSPSPNLAVCYVSELRQKHEGKIDGIKGMMKYLVLCERENLPEGEYGDWVRVVTLADLKTRLQAAGVQEWLADEIIRGNPSNKTVIKRVIRFFRAFERRIA